MTLFIDGQVDIPSPSAKLRSYKRVWGAALQSPLARRLIGYTVLFSSLITFTVSGAQLYMGFNQDLEAIESTIAQIRSSRSLSIVESVWVLDDHLVQVQLDGIARTPDIQSAAVFVNGKQRWFAGDKVESTSTSSYTIPLLKEEDGTVHWLGRLLVTADISALHSRVKNAAFLVLLGNAIKTFLVSFFFVLMFYTLIGKHLLVITRYARQYRPGSSAGALVLDRKLKSSAQVPDEIYALVESLNKMNAVIDNYRLKLSENERVAVQRAADLAVANKELEEFSSRTSHDLRAPIISALALLKVTNESLDADEVEEAKHGINYAQRSLENLKVLIDNITQLTLIKKQEEDLRNVSFSTLLNESLRLLSGMDGFSTIDIVQNLEFSGNLMTKETRLKTIVDNLLSNAIKYHDPAKDKSFVHINTWNEGENFVLQVSDNGLGIPKEYEDDLFKMFKRFHNNVAFGSGMGMHLMKTSADHIGAELVFESLADGASFTLVIPLRGDHEN